MQLAGHDQIERPQRTLHRVDLLNPLDWSLQIEALEHTRKKFEEEDRGVGHHAHAHLKHDRMRIHVDELMPDVPRTAKVEQQSNDKKQVSEERRQHCGTHNTVQSLDVEQVDRPHDAETASREHDPAQAVETDPQTPGKLVRHV